MTIGKHRFNTVRNHVHERSRRLGRLGAIQAWCRHGLCFQRAQGFNLSGVHSDDTHQCSQKSARAAIVRCRSDRRCQAQRTGKSKIEVLCLCWMTSWNRILSRCKQSLPSLFPRPWGRLRNMSSVITAASAEALTGVMYAFFLAVITVRSRSLRADAIACKHYVAISSAQRGIWGPAASQNINSRPAISDDADGWNLSDADNYTPTNVIITPRVHVFL